MKLWTLFISDDDHNETEMFKSEREAVERWVRLVFPASGEHSMRAYDAGKWDRAKELLAANTASEDTYILTEHTLNFSPLVNSLQGALEFLQDVARGCGETAADDNANAVADAINLLE